MLVNDNNREDYLHRMASHYGYDIIKLRKQVKDNPDILEGYAEHLANDFEDTPRNHRHYESTYYE